MNTVVLVPAPPHLHVRCALAVLAASVIASAMGLLAWGPVPPGLSVRGAVGADGAGVAPLWAAAWHAPALLAAWFGWRAAVAARRGAWREAWQVCFATAASAVLAAVMESVAPAALGPVLGRVPAASACAVVSLLFVAERLGVRWVCRLALVAALLSGPAAALACAGTHWLTGAPDVRALLWLEALPLVVVPLVIWGLPSRGVTGGDWLVVLGLLGLMEAMRRMPGDAAAHAVLQSVAPLALAGALAWLAHALRGPRSLQAIEPACDAGSASQRSTSPTTAVR